jgi:hypothetical protein
MICFKAYKKHDKSDEHNTNNKKMSLRLKVYLNEGWTTPRSPHSLSWISLTQEIGWL